MLDSFPSQPPLDATPLGFTASRLSGIALDPPPRYPLSRRANQFPLLADCRGTVQDRLSQWRVSVLLVPAIIISGLVPVGWIPRSKRDCSTHRQVRT